jgi:hypothetical protein
MSAADRQRLLLPAAYMLSSCWRLPGCTGSSPCRGCSACRQTQNSNLQDSSSGQQTGGLLVTEITELKQLMLHDPFIVTVSDQCA